jgi:hypothetical protein
MIFHKDAKTIQQGKHSLFSKWWLRKLYVLMQKIEAGPLPKTIYKNELKMEQRPTYKA